MCFPWYRGCQRNSVTGRLRLDAYGNAVPLIVPKGASQYRNVSGRVDVAMVRYFLGTPHHMTFARNLGVIPDPID